MRKLYLVLILLALAMPSKAAYLLVPMDDTQTNHLKAYGVAYWVLQREVEISWLLNYRGGSSPTPKPTPSLPKSPTQASTWTR